MAGCNRWRLKSSWCCSRPHLQKYWIFQVFYNEVNQSKKLYYYIITVLNNDWWQDWCLAHSSLYCHSSNPHDWDYLPMPVTVTPRLLLQNKPMFLFLTSSPINHTPLSLNVNISSSLSYSFIFCGLALQFDSLWIEGIKSHSAVVITGNHSGRSLERLNISHARLREDVKCAGERVSEQHILLEVGTCLYLTWRRALPSVNIQCAFVQKTYKQYVFFICS